jgi:lysophospholipase L1-like esterase
MRKFIVHSLWFIVAALVVFSGCAKREITNLNSQGRNIICFGDSITAGYGAEPGEDYPTALSGMTDAPVINAGVSADTTVNGLARIESDVLAKDPFLVIIEFFGNDFTRGIPKEETLDNIKEMVERIQAGGAMVAIADISAGMFLGEYRPALMKLSRQTHSIFIPAILSGIVTNPSMKSDFLHPNASGYKLIAQRIYLAIKPYLKDKM